jgi:hypothetical protein
MPDVGTFTAYPALADLPPLVRRQRQLETKILPFAPLVDEEKAVRKDIDALLIAAEVDVVTCNGYDVAHISRKGTERLNQEAFVARQVARGNDRATLEADLAASTDVGDPSGWATVKPSKGSKVRRALTEKHRR